MRSFKEFLTESPEPSVRLTIPLLIRALEWAREEAKSDVEVHTFVENITKKNGTVSTKDYKDLLRK